MRKRNKPHTKESILAECTKHGDCLLWPSLKPNGYGYIGFRGRARYAHQASYILHHERDIPAGYEIDHTCGNRACVNPAHLELVTHIENMTRAREKRLTCRAGHPFDNVNTRLFVVKRKQGGMRVQRYCLKCRAIAAQQRRMRAARKLDISPITCYDVIT